MAQAGASAARKKDAHEKIQLGGLIVKAGLRYETRATLLGLLLDAAERLRADDNERSRLRSIGERALTGDHI